MGARSGSATPGWTCSRRFVHVETPEKGSAAEKRAGRFTVFPRFHQWDAVLKLEAHAREHGAGHELPGPALGRVGEVEHDRLARAPALDPARRGRHEGLRQGRGHHRPRRARPPAPGHDLPVRARARRRREDRQGLAAARRGAGGRAGADHHHDAAEVPVRARQGRRAAGAPLRGDRRRGALLADRRGRQGAAARARRVGGGSACRGRERGRRRRARSRRRQDLLAASLAGRESHPNLSFFAFTATPKAKTLELFGTPTEGEERRFEPFHLYSMRQAIEEGFILDVLANYTTYKTYCRIEKAIADDPEYDEAQARRAIARFVTLHPHNLAQKAEIIVEHFREHTAAKIGGQAKAMVVTSSRLHAVRYKQAIDSYIDEHGYDDVHALVAFSGTIDELTVTESQMNGFPESRDRAKVRRGRLPGARRRREVPDRLRPAAAAHDVRGQAADRAARGADALPAQPHPPRQDGHLRPRLPQRAEDIQERSSRTTSAPSRCRPTRTSSTTRRALSEIDVLREEEVEAAVAALLAAPGAGRARRECTPRSIPALDRFERARATRSRTSSATR